MPKNDSGETSSKRSPKRPVPPTGSDSEKWSEELPMGRALFRVMRAIMFDDRPAPELDALPLAQLRLLWVVHFCREATMKDFSERLGVSQSTVTQLADRLVKRGLVDRLADASDRRVVRLRLSKAGQHLLSAADRERKLLLHAVWDALSTTEREDSLRGLEVLALAAEKVRAAQGRSLPPFPEHSDTPESGQERGGSPGEAQPVVDLMTRRVRGRIA